MILIWYDMFLGFIAIAVPRNVRESLCARIVILATAVMLCGCSGGRSDTPAGSNGVKASAGDGNDLELILRSWQEGDKDGAARALLETDMDAAIVSSTDDPVFTTSEKEFSRLDAGQKHELQEKAIVAVGQLKGLTRHCLERGREARARQDLDGARQHFEAVHRLGRALEEADCMLVLQQTGGAIVAMSQEELDPL